MAAGASVGAHSMHNFLDVDGLKRQDRSVLADPHARQLAQQFEPMIDRYRGDVALTRGAITLSARSPAGWVQDGIDTLRGPLAPGTPAAHDAQRTQADAVARQDQRMRQGIPHYEPIRSGVSLPDYLNPDGLHAPLREPVHARPLPFSDARHPQHALYEDVCERLGAKGAHFPEDRLSQITAALHNSHFKAGWDGRIDVKDDKVYAQNYQGFIHPGVIVSLQAPAPSVQTSLEDVRRQDQLRMERHETFMQQQHQARANGRGM